MDIYNYGAIIYDLYLKINLLAYNSNFFIYINQTRSKHINNLAYRYERSIRDSNK